MRRLPGTLPLMLAGVLLAAPPARAGGGGGGCLPDIPSNLGSAPGGTVYVADNCFLPSRIEIQPGEVVRWELRMAQAPHTVTFDIGPDSGDLEGPFAIRFNEPGRYEYFCSYHGDVGYGMAGTVVVEGEARSHLGEPSFDVVGTTGGASFSETSRLEPVALGGVDPGTREVLVRLDQGTAFTLVLVALAFGAAAGFVARGGRRAG